MDKKQELCLSCMACCHVLLIPLANLGAPRHDRTFYSPHALEFWRTRGCRPWMDDAGQEWMIIDFPCPQIGLHGCGIYKRRPYYCERYDGRLDPWIKKVCKWKELDDPNVQRL